MFICNVELLSLIMEEGEPIFYVVAEYNFDPGFQVEDELTLNWRIDKRRILKVKVVNREKIIYPKGSYEDCKDDSVLLLKIQVEAEDKKELLEIREFLAKHNPEKISM